MTRSIIHTDSAPKAIGTYSQAVRVGNTVYVSGQTPLDPATGTLVSGDIEVEIRRCFRQPYPARSTVGVAQLPKSSRVEIECILCLD